MVYIPDVNADSDIEIVNGTFDADANWNKSAAWTIAAGKATMAVRVPALMPFAQQILLLQVGNSYDVTFTLANTNFPVGGDGIIVTIGDGWDGLVYDSNGTFTSRIYYPEGVQFLKFSNRLAVQPSDCDLDNVSIVPLGSYVAAELGFEYPDPQAAVFYEAADLDHIYKVLSYNSKTNCDIKYTP